MSRFRDQDLGQFLRHRRERLTTRDVGIVGGDRRRTPGLRREEVALLASMSSNYYERLEQARGPQPSPGMVGSIARALRLTLDERDHLYALAGHQPPPPHIALGYADPGLMTVLASLAPTVPALVCDALNTVVAQNALNIALLGPLADRHGVESNFTWHWFVDPAYRSLYAPNDWEALSRGYVADLRAASVAPELEPALAPLLTALHQGSVDFRRIWGLLEVAVKQPVRKLLHHPLVGLLDCQCDIVTSEQTRQRLVLFRPTPGTDTAEKIDMLRVVGTQVLTP